MKNFTVKSFLITICSLILFVLITVSPASAKFINTFLIKIGGNKFTNSEATAKYLAQYDVIITRKMQSANIGGSYGSTWKAIKKYNPNCKIHLYTKVNITHPDSDSTKIYYTNNLARFNISRGHSDGNLANHDDYFLHQNGKIWIHKSKNGGYLLNPAKGKFQAYSLEATLNDYKYQAWAADGVYTDLLYSDVTVLGKNDEYATQNAWSNAVQSFINYLTKGLNEKGQAFTVNHGNTRYTSIKKHWIALNAIYNPPDFLLEEAAYAVLYGEGSDIQFYPEYHWKNQIDTMVAMTNIGFLSAASTNLVSIDDTGIDNYGKAFSGWDALYFSMGSYCLGKDDNDAFYFNTADYLYGRWDHYYDEYDLIDLGQAVGSYKVINISGNNIYYREFANGFVYVNPTNNKVASIQLQEQCKQRTHNNLYNDFDSLQSVTTISLNAHRAAFLYKSEPQQNIISPPKNLRQTN
jgi:hypothetical protein